MGEASQDVDIPIKGTMAVGFSVYRDSKDKSKRYCAMVANLDSTFGRYFSTSTDELLASFPLNIMKVVERYQKINGKLPNPVILYGDSVGDSDLETACEVEVAAIKKALGTLYERQKLTLRFAVIIVTKRINTRFVVINSHRSEFFLVSQSVRYGAVSPTHYNVLYNDTRLRLDQLQRLTYKISNSRGTVLVLVPYQYAYKRRCISLL